MRCTGAGAGASAGAALPSSGSLHHADGSTSTCTTPRSCCPRPRLAALHPAPTITPHICDRSISFFIKAIADGVYYASIGEAPGSLVCGIAPHMHHRSRSDGSEPQHHCRMRFDSDIFHFTHCCPVVSVRPQISNSRLLPGWPAEHRERRHANCLGSVALVVQGYCDCAAGEVARPYRQVARHNRGALWGGVLVHRDDLK